MCDKGLLEMDPELAKLDYCIVISKELQKFIVDGINNLLEDGDSCFINSPKAGKYPEQNVSGTNTFDIRSLLNPIRGDIYRTICGFSLKELSGCCGILVSYHMTVSSNYRGKGIAKFLQEVKERIAKENGYSTLLCTTRASNETENHILEKNGWKQISLFRNKRTNHDLFIWTKEL